MEPRLILACAPGHGLFIWPTQVAGGASVGNQLACPGLEVSRRWRKSQLSWPNACQQRVGSRVPGGACGPGERTKGGCGFGRHGRQKDLAGAWGMVENNKGAPSVSSNGPACGCDRLLWAGDLNYETKLLPRRAPIWGLFESMSCLRIQYHCGSPGRI